jgi:succinate dehydrogenase/fumarate reductase-like Fe-S protein
VSRRSALVGLGWAYARHQVRRRLRPPPKSNAQDVQTTYAEDRLRPLTSNERARLPAMSRCINCGLCALVVKRMGGIRLADLPATYMRDYTHLQAAVLDFNGADPGTHALLTAAAVCPVGVPLEEVAEAVRRLAEPAP